MTQIYNASPKELAAMAQRYLRDGILSRATYCYERLMYLGCLRRTSYLRLSLYIPSKEKITPQSAFYADIKQFININIGDIRL